MNSQQQVVWLSWFRYHDALAQGLFAEIEPSMFTNESLGWIFKLVKEKKLNYANGEIAQVIAIMEQEAMNIENTWIPIFPQRLKEGMKAECLPGPPATVMWMSSGSRPMVSHSPSGLWPVLV